MKLKRLKNKELTLKKLRLKNLRLKWLAAALAVFFIIYIAGTAVSIWRYGKIDEKQKADVAIVLGAATYGEKVSPVFEERLSHGIWLYENGYVKKLIVTGGVGAGNPHSDSYFLSWQEKSSSISDTSFGEFTYNSTLAETEGRFARLFLSVPSGMLFKYSLSPRWATPTPLIWPDFAKATPSSLETVRPSESW